jgi:hypothetical protein
MIAFLPKKDRRKKLCHIVKVLKGKILKRIGFTVTNAWNQFYEQHFSRNDNDDFKMSGKAPSIGILIFRIDAILLLNPCFCLSLFHFFMSFLKK